jgi:hypothetical protein
MFRFMKILRGVLMEKDNRERKDMGPVASKE